MTTSAGNPLTEPFLAAARAAADERSDVDADLAEELMGEAAMMLHNGLALDGLDDHDTHLVTHGLGVALTARTRVLPCDQRRKWCSIAPANCTTPILPTWHTSTRSTSCSSRALEHGR